MNIRIKIAIGAAVFAVVGVLAVRFGPQLAAPFLSSDAPSDTQTVTVQAGDTTRPALALAADTSGMLIRHGPFVVNGMAYTFQVQRDTAESKPKSAARRVQVFDSTGRTVYDENLFLRTDSTSSESWLEFGVSLLEDESGVARGFNFSYAWFPAPAGSGVAFNIVAPRRDSLVVLTPTVIGFYGSKGRLPEGSVAGSRRLLPGNQLTIDASRGWFRETIPLRVNFDCAPGTPDCVRIDIKDSIAGLARFAVLPEAQQPTTTSPVITVFGVPHAAVSDTIRIPTGTTVEITGGAARIYFERTPSLFLSADDEWLEIRVNNRRYWITGEEAFRAIGLQQVG